MFTISISFSSISAEDYESGSDKIIFTYFTGEEFEIEYVFEDVNIKNTFTDKNSMNFELVSTDGYLVLDFPKSIPLGTLDRDYPSLIVIDNGGKIFDPFLDENTPYTRTENDCTINVKFEFDNEVEHLTTITINHGFYPEGYSLAYYDLPEKCLEDPRNDTEIQRSLNAKNCSDVHYEKGLNVRDEVVCIYSDSYPWLYQRGYLKTYEIISTLD